MTKEELAPLGRTRERAVRRSVPPLLLFSTNVWAVNERLRKGDARCGRGRKYRAQWKRVKGGSSLDPVTVCGDRGDPAQNLAGKGFLHALLLTITVSAPMRMVREKSSNRDNALNSTGT